MMSHILCVRDCVNLVYLDGSSLLALKFVFYGKKKKIIVDETALKMSHLHLYCSEHDKFVS